MVVGVVVIVVNVVVFGLLLLLLFCPMISLVLTMAEQLPSANFSHRYFRLEKFHMVRNIRFFSPTGSLKFFLIF